MAEVRAVKRFAMARRVRSEETTVRPVLDVRRADVGAMSFLVT